MRLGKAATQNLRAVARTGSDSELANLVRKYLFVREHKAVRQMQRKLLSKTTTLAAIQAAKSGKVTEASIDDL